MTQYHSRVVNRKLIGIELEPKILLVNPPFKYLMSLPVIPLGLLNLGTILLDHGFEVKLLDCMAEKENELKYLPDVLSPEHFIREVKKFAPDIIGITSCTENYPIALAIAQLCKEADTNVKILLGGSHVSFQAIECLMNNPFIDAVAIGETEHVIIDIMEGLSGKKALKNISNLAYRANKVIKMEDSMTVPTLNDIPAPNLDLIKNKHYPSYLCHVEFSRGCPYKCNFCSVHPFSNNQVRYFPISRIMECLYSYAEFFKDYQFFVTDPTFLLNHKQILHFVEEVKAAQLQLPLWDFQTRVNLISREILQALKRINAYEITLGIEDIHDSVLKIIGKNQTISQIERAIKLIGELGLKSHSNFIIGLPTQTKDQALETITYASKLDRFNFSTIKPFPGTPLLTRPEAFGMAILTNNWADYNSFEIVMDSRAFPVHAQEEARECALRQYAQVHIERDLFDIYSYAEYKYLLNSGFDPWYARWKKEHWSGWN